MKDSPQKETLPISGVNNLDCTIQNPTQQSYTEMVTAYDYFNLHLFGNKLPNCLITLNRKRNTYGYFTRERFVSKQENKTDEIALNPEGFYGRTDLEILSTLVHEMAHLWQHHFGKEGRGRYHNKEWAAFMKTIGLYPSDTGKEGGKETGETVSHYTISGGPFETNAHALLAQGFVITWRDTFRMPERKPRKAKPVEGVEPQNEPEGEENEPSEDNGEATDRSNRIKYTCPACKSNAWGKPGLRLICGLDHILFNAKTA